MPLEAVFLTTYIGCLPSSEVMAKVLEISLKKANLWGVDQEISFPLIIKSGTNQYGKAIHYYFNYEIKSNSCKYPYNTGTDLLTNKIISSNELIKIEPWGIKIIEEN